MTQPMFRHLAPAAVLAGAFLMMAPAAHAQDAQPDFVGKEAGTLMVRLRAIDVLPLDSSSSISAIGGRVHATNQVAPEADFSYFFTDHIAAELIAGTTRHAIQARGTALGTVDVGSAYVLPPALTLQYHFFPHERLSPYVGAGIDVMFFYDQHTGTPGAVTKLDVRPAVGPALQAGVDYNVTGHWFVNADLKLLLVSPNANIDALGDHLRAKVALNPLVAGIGVGYRF